jgi:hypothetical protein
MLVLLAASTRAGLISADLGHQYLERDNTVACFRGGLDVCDRLFTDTRLYDYLLEIDRDLARRARHEGCPRCAGRLDSATYLRKPRGGPARGAAHSPLALRKRF